LFFTIGNGYEWENGKLENVFPEEDRDRWFPEGSDPEFHYRIEAFEKEWYKSNPYTNWYPISEYSHICNVPENVAPEWLAICIEACKEYLKTPDDAKKMGVSFDYSGGGEKPRLYMAPWRSHSELTMDKARVFEILQNLLTR
jgi:hypothetical protein